MIDELKRVQFLFFLSVCNVLHSRISGGVVFQQDIDLIKKDFEARAVSVAGIFKFPTLELLVFVVISLE